MSQENVEIVRRGVEALNAGDLDRHCAEFFNPEVGWRTSAEDPDAATPGDWGRTGVTSSSGWRALKVYHVNVEEFIDVGADRVLTWNRYTGRGRESGVPADWHLAIIFTLRDGRIVRGEEYFDRAEALEAAGVSRVGDSTLERRDADRRCLRGRLRRQLVDAQLPRPHPLAGIGRHREQVGVRRGLPADHLRVGMHRGRGR